MSLDPPRAPRLQLATPAQPVADLSELSEIAQTRPALTADQRARLDRLAIDRAHFDRYPLPRWSPEGEKGEAYARSIREETTISERIAALKALTGGKDPRRSGTRPKRWWRKLFRRA